MERFESNNEKERREGEKIEVKIEKNRSLIQNIRERFPSFEKIYKSGKITLQMLAAIVVFGVGQNLFAEENSKEKENPFWNFQNLNKLKSENLSTIYNKIPSPAVSIPEGRNILGSYTLSGNSKDEPQRIISGEIPSQNGVFGDLIIHTDSKIIEKENLENQNLAYADTASFFVEVIKAEKEDVENKEIIRRVVTAEGKTREQAIFSAISKIGETGVISVKNMKKIEKVENGGDYSDNFLSISSISGMNYVKGVKIVSERQLDGGSYEITVEGDVVYNAE